METLELMTSELMPAVDLESSNDLFFECPLGGYASLRPGLCPKCSESLVPVVPIGLVADDQLIGRADDDNRRRFCQINRELSVKAQVSVCKQTMR